MSTVAELVKQVERAGGPLAYNEHTDMVTVHGELYIFPLRDLFDNEIVEDAVVGAVRRAGRAGGA